MNSDSNYPDAGNGFLAGCSNMCAMTTAEGVCRWSSIAGNRRLEFAVYRGRWWERRSSRGHDGPVAITRKLEAMREEIWEIQVAGRVGNSREC